MYNKVVIKLGKEYTSRFSVDMNGQVIMTDMHNERNKLVSYVAMTLSKDQANEIASMLLRYAEGK